MARTIYGYVVELSAHFGLVMLGRAKYSLYRELPLCLKNRIGVTTGPKIINGTDQKNEHCLCCGCLTHLGMAQAFPAPAYQALGPHEAGGFAQTYCLLAGYISTNVTNPAPLRLLPRAAATRPLQRSHPTTHTKPASESLIVVSEQHLQGLICTCSLLNCGTVGSLPPQPRRLFTG